MLGLVGFDSGIGVVDVTAQDTIDEDRELASRGGNGLGFADDVPPELSSTQV